MSQCIPSIILLLCVLKVVKEKRKKLQWNETQLLGNDQISRCLFSLSGVILEDCGLKMKEQVPSLSKINLRQWPVL